MEAQLEYRRTLHARFLYVWRRLLSRCFLTKFLHRRSVGSLLRVHCWLGTLTTSCYGTVERKKPSPISAFASRGQRKKGKILLPPFSPINHDLSPFGKTVGARKREKKIKGRRKLGGNGLRGPFFWWRMDREREEEKITHSFNQLCPTFLGSPTCTCTTVLPNRTGATGNLLLF